MKRLLALGATAAVLALGVVGVLPSPAESAAGFPPGRPTRVLVLGDSVIKGAESQVIAALPGREVVFDAEVNRSTGTGADIVSQRGADWDVVVVLLGHNDGGSPGVFQPAARSIIDQLRSVPYVSWLTIHEVRPYYPDVNHYIAGLQSQYPNLHVGDWNAIAAAHPEALSGDGLHLNGTGGSLMAGLVLEQVEAGEQQFNQQYLALVAAAATTTTTAPPTTTTTAPPTTTTSTSTSTSTSTTAAASTTTAAPETAVPSQDDDDGSPLPYVAGVVITVLVVGGLVLWRRKRAERSDQAAADTAG